ncbi:UNVERIFIED_CONTAM: hypothetical protein GTU68_064697, partial [Idotea baltica]|nr:hypothetical protein [Idotea baltica]
KIQQQKKINSQKANESFENQLKENLSKGEEGTGEFMSKEAVKKHSSEEDCWIIINNNIYNVTNFLENHPGGVDAIMEWAGKDAT